MREVVIRSEDSATNLKPAESILMEPVARLCRFSERIAVRVREGREITVEEAKLLAKVPRHIQELFTYLTPRGPQIPREWLESGREALALLVGTQSAEQAYYAAGEDSRGRPVMRRHVAAFALEAKERNPQWKRSELTRRFCPCGKSHHNSECVERLRRDIQRLKALVKEILSAYPA